MPHGISQPKTTILRHYKNFLRDPREGEIHDKQINFRTFIRVLLPFCILLSSILMKLTSFCSSSNSNTPWNSQLKWRLARVWFRFKQEQMSFRWHFCTTDSRWQTTLYSKLLRILFYLTLIRNTLLQPILQQRTITTPQPLCSIKIWYTTSYHRSFQQMDWHLLVAELFSNALLFSEKLLKFLRINDLNKR